MIDILLGTVGLVTAVWAGYLVWRKLPLLAQVPQQLIEESFVTRPSRAKKTAESVSVFFRERHYVELYRRILLATLNRFRIWLLRSERVVYSKIEQLRATEEAPAAIMPTAEGGGEFWNDLKQWKQVSKPEAVVAAATIEDAPSAPSILPTGIAVPSPVLSAQDAAIVADPSLQPKRAPRKRGPRSRRAKTTSEAV